MFNKKLHPSIKRELPPNSGVGNYVCKTSVVFSTVILYSSSQKTKLHGTSHEFSKSITTQTTVDGSEIPRPTTWNIENLVNNGILTISTGERRISGCHHQYQTHVMSFCCLVLLLVCLPLHPPTNSDFCRWMMKLPTGPTLRNADQPVHIYLVMRGWIPWKVDLGGFRWMRKSD